MKPLEYYTREMSEIVQQSDKRKGIGGSLTAWAMMIVGVIVTGTMTYSLTHKGMESAALWKTWIDFAALLPVTLLEGSALALVYGRHHWFRSNEQRGIANIAGWLVWILLAATSITHFAFGSSSVSGTAQRLMSVYASYILPLAIVAVPMLWKKLYDAAPDSAVRVAVLEIEAELRAELVKIQREQNELMVTAYRDGLDTPQVRAARNTLFEQASVNHAHSIVGFISAVVPPNMDMHSRTLSESERVLAEPGQRINGVDLRPNEAGR